MRSVQRRARQADAPENDRESGRTVGHPFPACSPSRVGTRTRESLRNLEEGFSAACQRLPCILSKGMSSIGATAHRVGASQIMQCHPAEADARGELIGRPIGSKHILSISCPFVKGKKPFPNLSPSRSGFR